MATTTPLTKPRRKPAAPSMSLPEAIAAAGPHSDTVVTADKRGTDRSILALVLPAGMTSEIACIRRKGHQEHDIVILGLSATAADVQPMYWEIVVSNGINPSELRLVLDKEDEIAWSCDPKGCSSERGTTLSRTQVLQAICKGLTFGRILAN